jgi:hypothetical protein
MVSECKGMVRLAPLSPHLAHMYMCICVSLSLTRSHTSINDRLSKKSKQTKNMKKEKKNNRETVWVSCHHSARHSPVHGFCYSTPHRTAAHTAHRTHCSVPCCTLHTPRLHGVLARLLCTSIMFIPSMHKPSNTRFTVSDSALTHICAS